MTLHVFDVELADIARRRSSTWWLLSRLVIEQPQEPWLGELEAVLAAVDTRAVTPLGAEAAALLTALQAARLSADGPTRLAVDRTSLLAGVLHKKTLPAPYESAALHLDMNSDWVMDVIQCYQDAGLVDFGLELGPPDYLGTELRFMSILAYQEMQAHQAGDCGLAAQWLAMQQHFLETHLLNWVPEHCERLASLAQTPFYKATSTLLSAACQLDQRDLVQVAMRITQPMTDEFVDEVAA
ncbi:chaperone protein TorD [Rhodoferax lithotrophicus]|uniref:Chaperone protein TorD n=1 Tax=Rhodoferax lithotrophicus TaxID=2798804 RepID=A0ABM7MGR1_9BURK|nr:molecular chaperone TorD family protein [Rhodoferax sp. MIZ03]BCO25353.1 chaperone protein TorD [Rhodoferax sp. MIZ03]